jgi:hypothetical protein
MSERLGDRALHLVPLDPGARGRGRRGDDDRRQNEEPDERQGSDGDGAAPRTVVRQVGPRVDLTPSGIRAGPAGAAAPLRTAAWLVDTAAATSRAGRLAQPLSDSDGTAFITALEAVVVSL